MTKEFNLSADEIKKVLGFLGYGKSSGSVWFIGKEEGLGDMTSDDAIRNLKARGGFEDVMDLYRAHRNLWEDGCLVDFERKIPRTQVWKFMAKIMLAIEGYRKWADKDEANEYVRSRLGRSNGKTFMTELSPIPAGHGADKRWLEMFQQNDSDISGKLERRKENLQQLLKDSAPRLVICYGHTKADAFADLLGISWVWKSEQISTSADEKCLLLPFFGQGHMSRSVIETLLRDNLLS